ncbi:MAG: PhoH family protein [Actinomycetaceae bacterium]|nr:PhoH family protein [Actinomycetaceae bacterium]
MAHEDNGDITAQAVRTSTVTVTIPDEIDPVEILGPNDQVLRALERRYKDIDMLARSKTLRLTGPTSSISKVVDFFNELITYAQSGKPISPDAVEEAISMIGTTGIRQPVSANRYTLMAGSQVSPAGGSEEILQHRGVHVSPKTAGQNLYVEAIDAATIVFGIGPAGTGKTYLAMAKAVQALYAGDVKRIILTRPAVEAGESLGYLPGTLTEKINPYLRPLYDALHEMVGTKDLGPLMESGAIEVAPLAYMRGRTLNDAFIVLDEAQNTTPQQMKMFLTRLGFRSKMVVTGDISQIDLPGGTRSGLKVIRRILQDVNDITFCYLTSDDVVRHELVGRIIDAYDTWENAQPKKGRH